MSRQRIVILTSLHPATDIRIYHKQAVSLAKEYDVHIIATEDKPRDLSPVSFHILQKENTRLKRFAFTLPAILISAIRLDATVYHFHDPELILVGIILKIMGKKVIYDIHEDTYKQILSKRWIPKYLRTIVANIYKVLLLAAGKLFDALICATDGIQSTLKTHSVTIKNYPILGELSPNQGNLQKDKVCYVGAVAMNRGLLQMVTVAENKGINLVIAGPFQHEQEHQQIKTMEGWKNVSYRGVLNRNHVKSLLNESYAGLVTLLPIPYFLDSLPIKMFEYMEAGVPVIASNFPFWQGIVEKYNCGYCVDPNNVDEIKRLIIELKNNPERVRALGENGQKAIREHFNWERKKIA